MDLEGRAYRLPTSLHADRGWAGMPPKHFDATLVSFADNDASASRANVPLIGQPFKILRPEGSQVFIAHFRRALDSGRGQCLQAQRHRWRDTTLWVDLSHLQAIGCQRSKGDGIYPPIPVVAIASIIDNPLEAGVGQTGSRFEGIDLARADESRADEAIHCWRQRDQVDDGALLRRTESIDIIRRCEEAIQPRRHIPVDGRRGGRHRRGPHQGAICCFYPPVACNRSIAR